RRNASIRRRSLTSNGGCKTARPAARRTAASSATSPAASTGYSNTERHRRLDRHRSIARPDFATVLRPHDLARNEMRRRYRHQHDWEVVDKTLVEGISLADAIGAATSPTFPEAR